MLNLFDILDTKQDGVLDQREFEQLYDVDSYFDEKIAANIGTAGTRSATVNHRTHNNNDLHSMLSGRNEQPEYIEDAQDYHTTNNR